MGIALGGGLSRAQHASLPHTSAMITDGTITNDDIAAAAAIAYTKLALTGMKVKLPAPSESDYATPSAVSAFGTNLYPVTISDKVLRNPTPVTDQPNIYDNDDETFARLTNDIPVTTQEVLVWDMGSVDKRNVTYKIGSGSPSQKVRLQCSSDDVEYTLIDEAVNGIKSGGEVLTFRYLKWESQNIDAIQHPGSDHKYYTLNVEEYTYPESNTIDEGVDTKWRADEIGAWCRWDMEALKICGGLRVYWGADEAYRPTAYRIEVSENGTDWTTVATETEAAPASAWKEYSFNAWYARYIRLIVDTHSASGTEIFEADYYSRITERVAAEHGHC